MEITIVRWRLREYLEANEKTPYSLIKASGLTQTTVYAIAQGKTSEVRFDTLAAIIRGLEKLTGKQVSLLDILEVVRSI
jgi:DNA-binding Xre family transcriptional regulator